MRKNKWNLWLLGVVALLGSCARPGTQQTERESPMREFRAFWVATVVNIDWPSAGGIPWEQQKDEFRALLAYYKNLNMNAAIVQIRTAGDAFYPTELAPWSAYLTGKQGQAPASEEDPLLWMIKETHRHGMEFHAWLNPYRATFDDRLELLAPEHDVLRYPEWMIAYGGKYYYDPGLPEVQEHLLKIIREVVLKYPIDAIHFDDYFYPYKVEGETFGDADSYARLAREGQSLDDWRRENVNKLIASLHATIKELKPYVQFGISPFGVWRNQDRDPKGSATQAGQTNYDDLYADALAWMEAGTVDYMLPQLYWSMDYSLASHRVLLDWWADYADKCLIYIGNGAYKIRNNADLAWEDPQEIPRQLALARQDPRISGNAFFSAKSFPAQPDVAEILRESLYNAPALVPVLPSAPAPAKIPAMQVSQTGGEMQIDFAAPLPEEINRVVFFQPKGHGQQLAAVHYLDFQEGRRSGQCAESPKKGQKWAFMDAYGQIIYP
ncbi:MAG: glycoside hydrolase family 10 protein [Nitritalea sp.]